MAAYVPTPMSSVEIEPYDGEEQPWTAMTPGGGSGLVVLSSTLLPLYVNPEAFELLRLLNLKDSFLDDGSCAWGRLPEVLRQLGAEMVGFLKMRMEAADWRPVDLKRLAGDLSRPIQLHGVGVPDRRGIARVRIIVTIEEVIPSQRTPQRAACRGSRHERGCVGRREIHVRRIGEQVPTVRFPAVIDGEVLYIDTGKFLGQWVVLSFVPVLGESERELWNRQGKELIALGAALLVVPSQAQAVHQARVLREGQMYFTVVGDPLERLQRIYGGRTMQSSGRGRTFLIDPDGLLRFHLVHGPTERGMRVLVKLLQACQDTEATALV